MDIKYLGIPNICFSLTSKDDKREEKFVQQRIERGFDDSETWSLRDTIGNFVLPRLRVFRQKIGENIIDTDDFYVKVDRMIRALELLVRDQGRFELSEDEMKEYDEGMKSFSENFLRLSW